MIKRPVVFILIFLFSALIFLAGCGSLQDTANDIGDNIGKAGDNLSKEHKVGSGENPVIVSPLESKKIKVKF